MINAIIVDDEVKARRTLKDDLTTWCRDEVILVAEANDVEAAIAAINKFQPQLVFLDVHLGNNEIGFQILEQIPEIKFHVIFTTAHDNYAIQAFKFSAIDYLLKPIDPDELINAVQKAKSQINQINLAKIQVLIDNYKNKQPAKKKIILASEDSLTAYEIQDIIRCEAQRNYTLFYFVNQKKLLVSKTLKEFEFLTTDHNFYRTHHSHLINLNHFLKYIKKDGGYTVMIDDSNVPVSTRNREGFLEKIKLL